MKSLLELVFWVWLCICGNTEQSWSCSKSNNIKMSSFDFVCLFLVIGTMFSFIPNNKIKINK
jgi:hypothetical protein